jgi:hypothetical protein
MRDVKWATKHDLHLTTLNTRMVAKHDNAWPKVRKSSHVWRNVKSDICEKKGQEWEFIITRDKVTMRDVKRATKYDLALNQIKRNIISVPMRDQA